MAWKSDIKNVDNLDLQTAELFLSLAKERLGDTITTFSSTTQRTHFIIAGNLSAITFIVGFLIEGVENSALMISLIILNIFLISSLILSSKNLRTSSIWTVGTEPRGIVQKRFLKKEKQFEKLCISLCNLYQEKIRHNISVNKEREKNIFRSIRVLIFSPTSFLLGIGIDFFFC